MRHSESYDELTRESPNHEECEVQCEAEAPSLLLDRTNHGQRSNSFSKLCSELSGYEDAVFTSWVAELSRIAGGLDTGQF